MAGEIKTMFLEGPSGRLEAILNSGDAKPTHVALVCHPHPLFGGTMHNKVVYHAMKALNGFGFPVLRFNFRGAGSSEGAHDEGRGEKDDVRAALDWLKREFNLPVIFAGFSFGASIGLRACCPRPEVIALISLGTPVRSGETTYRFSFLSQCVKPKLFISGDHDPFGPREELERVIGNAAEPKKLVIIEAADHFFEGKLDQLRSVIHDWVAELLPRVASSAPL